MVLFKKQIRFLECSSSHSCKVSEAQRASHLQETRSIHDCMSRAKIEFIAYNLHFIINI